MLSARSRRLQRLGTQAAGRRRPGGRPRRPVYELDLLENRSLLATIGGTAFIDVNADGVQDVGESPLSGVTVFLDTNDNGVADNGTFASTNVPITIPTVGTINSTNPVSASGTITDVDVTVNLTHTWDSDIAISLISPLGTIIDLSSNNGGSADNYQVTTFNDEAATAITAGTPPFNGSFRPEQALSTLDGEEMNGAWTLRIADTVAGDGGQLIA